MKTNGPVLCVEDLSLAAHRRLLLSASANKSKSKNGRKVEATMEGKRCERVGKGTGERGRGLGGGAGGGGGGWGAGADPLEESRFDRRTLGLIYGSHRRTPLPPPSRQGPL